MKRSSILSTLVLSGLAVAMAGSFVVAVRAMQAAHNHCLNGCEKNQKPPGCCEPPKCDFEYALYVNTARVRSFAQLKNQMPNGPGQTPVKPLNFGKLNAAIT